MMLKLFICNDLGLLKPTGDHIGANALPDILRDYWPPLRLLIDSILKSSDLR
jgi:hypothetical protein